MQITVATYNVHGWTGTDGRKDPDRTFHVLRELGADVVALQEVSLPVDDSPTSDLAYFSKITGMHATPGPTLTKGHGDYGNLLLSTRAMERTEKLDLSVDAREPRGAVIGLLRMEGMWVKTIATHLGLRFKERKLQWRRLLEKIDLDSDEINVVLGDLNEWNPFGRNARWLRSFFGGAPAPCSYPAWYPVLSLDRILVYPKTAAAQVRVHRSPLARVASDHLPVVAGVVL